MNVAALNVTKSQAIEAVRQYKAHRAVFDRRDSEIERIYRRIAKGDVVISVHDAIRSAGVDEIGRPKLAIMRADQQWCKCNAVYAHEVTFTNLNSSRSMDWHFVIPWSPRKVVEGWTTLSAMLPRIPPQHRPKAEDLAKYHILWEADWKAIPRDPMLLKRIGKDAWVVVAAWDLTDVEMLVLRSHNAGQ